MRRWPRHNRPNADSSPDSSDDPYGHRAAVILVQWNALRPGDHVLVHDDADRAMPLLSGVVATIQTAASSNDVAIRICVPTGGHGVRRPGRLAVHLPQLDPREACWRCAIAATRGANERPVRNERKP